MIDENEVNIRNKLSRGKFGAALLLQCLIVTGSFQPYLGWQLLL